MVFIEANSGTTPQEMAFKAFSSVDGPPGIHARVNIDDVNAVSQILHGSLDTELESGRENSFQPLTFGRLFHSYDAPVKTFNWKLDTEGVAAGKKPLATNPSYAQEAAPAPVTSPFALPWVIYETVTGIGSLASPNRRLKTASRALFLGGLSLGEIACTPQGAATPSETAVLPTAEAQITHVPTQKPPETPTPPPDFQTEIPPGTPDNIQSGHPDYLDSSVTTGVAFTRGASGAELTKNIAGLPEYAKEAYLESIEVIGGKVSGEQGAKVFWNKDFTRNFVLPYRVNDKGVTEIAMITAGKEASYHPNAEWFDAANPSQEPKYSWVALPAGVTIDDVVGGYRGEYPIWGYTEVSSTIPASIFAPGSQMEFIENERVTVASTEASPAETEVAAPKDGQTRMVEVEVDGKTIEQEQVYRVIKDKDGNVLYAEWVRVKTARDGISLQDYITDEYLGYDQMGRIQVVCSDKFEGCASVPKFTHMNQISEEGGAGVTGRLTPIIRDRLGGLTSKSFFDYQMSHPNGLDFNFFLTDPEHPLTWTMRPEPHTSVTEIITDWNDPILEGAQEIEIDSFFTIKAKILGVDENRRLIGVVALNNLPPEGAEYIWDAVIFLHSAMVLQQEDVTNIDDLNVLNEIMDAAAQKDLQGNTWVIQESDN